MNEQITRILLMSDTHGETKKMKRVLKKETYDVSIHLGDSEKDDSFLRTHFDYYVRGNCDFDNFSDELIIEINQTKFLLLHGHTVGTSQFNYEQTLASFAKQNNVKNIIFGHIHFPVSTTIDGINIFNPGSLERPRNGSRQSYMILELKNGKIKAIQKDA